MKKKKIKLDIHITDLQGKAIIQLPSDITLADFPMVIPAPKIVIERRNK